MEQLILAGSSEDAFLKLYTLSSQTLIGSLKQNNHTNLTTYSPNLITIYNSSLIASIQSDRQLLNLYIYPNNNDTPKLKFSLPEKLESIQFLNVNKNELLLIGGSINGNLFIWEVNTGKLVKVIENCHFKRIGCIEVGLDNKIIVTGSDDGKVNVWRLSELYHPINNDIPQPHFILSTHTLPITKILLTSTTIITSSLDNTISIHDLSSGKLMATYLIPSPVTCMAVTKRGNNLIAGGKDGWLYQLNLTLTESTIHEAIRVGERINNGAIITSLLYDITSTQLILGTSTGQIHLLDPLTFLSTNFIINNGTITHLSCLSNKSNLNVNKKEFNWLTPFQKIEKIDNMTGLISKEIEDDDEEVEWPGYLKNNIKSNVKVSLIDKSTQMSPPPKMLENTEELQQQLKTLYQAYNQQKQINSDLYDHLLNLKNQ